MPAYYIWTIGCQMNRAESERLRAMLEGQGYLESPSPEHADLVILNSCVVRAHAEDKVVNKLANLRAWKKAHPRAVLAVTGCLVGAEAEELAVRFPQVDHFFPPGQVPDWLGKAALPSAPGVSVFVPIIQGCNNFCTYCIVPYRRGRERSRPLAEVVAEVRELAARGAKEVTLLGQNVDSYGHDLADKPDLAALLEALNDIPGLARIRFLTNHPKDMGPRLIRALAALPKVCRAINLPVQAGDDAVLQAMNRGYTVARYRELVASMRSAVPDIAITTDLIVGFPGETEEQFRHSAELMAELRFDQVHVAAYSPRAGTVAARTLADDVPAEVKAARLAFIEAQQEGIAREINAGLLHSRLEVLVEAREKGKWRGRTRSDKLVFSTGGSALEGRLVMVDITGASAWSLQGKTCLPGAPALPRDHGEGTD
jgi:tRNA-2-methylthio-N6-dimethylallyladenosine synthase